MKRKACFYLHFRVQVTSAKPKLRKMFDIHNKTCGFHKQNVDAAKGADFMSARLPSPIHSWSEQQRMAKILFQTVATQLL